ncbi:molecular chaperone [Xanthomonas vasicola]|uniref:Pilus assembly protein n=1 Tax=Xanthomonas vasicola pv. vasculorum NCPPB 890 TaxID=1184265 RepID=A0A836P4N4_XANVA|nr:fimbria/pilus periplasmic chaperone [Xanthomonas vasicola]KFA24441.1 pilus assembly protein [Xanthomonas vasicola pv. vasculorum NCPPB 1326]KFA33055.1 pilus assembly protein [Xanthomonas vasicola pv. vasculorum NCPPB 1381]MBV6744733.1 fimbria/pilus periplasmic chaperone [Xanthomonas vasicola pv. vasculorum NCPPB 890]MBV6890551.1 fimbria/pilus periplasmic chaperone [Xanthomonas vasicola pv. vasculorum]MDO6947063.1 fimbria/pilus periplasmic chaperone [Xanthomonas vasicola]
MAAPRHLRALLTPLLIMACAAGSGAAGAAEIAIAPTTAHIPADSDQATVWLYNQAAQPWRADAKLYRWRQDGEGELLEPATGITVSPAHFEIPSQGRQLLRVIRLGPSPTQAEESYRLVVTQHAIGNETELLRYSTPVFAQPSQASARQPALQATLAGHGSDRTLRIYNPGVSHARLADLAYIDAGGTRRSIRNDLAGYVLPGQTRQWALPANLPAGSGRFVARINSDIETTLALEP